MDYEELSSYDRGKTDYASLILLLLLLIGLHRNISVASFLKTHWQHLSNLKIVISICVSANSLALFFDIYKPLNSILQGDSLINPSPRHWVFGQFLCAVLPPASKLALAASVVSWSALAHCCYHMKVYKYHLTKSGTETLVFLVWAIAATLTAPIFCAQLLVYDGESRAELCLTLWASSRQGKLNNAWLIVLQYAIPFASIASSVAKTVLYPTDPKKLTPRWYPFVACGIDMLSIVGVLVIVCLVPFGVDDFDPRFQRGVPVIDPHQTLDFLGSFALSMCLAMPFILHALIKRELRKPQPGENSSDKDISKWKFIRIKEAINQQEIV